MGKLRVGKHKQQQVALVRDDEFLDRYFLVIKTKRELVVRITIAGANVGFIVTALRQAKEDLDVSDAK